MIKLGLLLVVIISALVGGLTLYLLRKKNDKVDYNPEDSVRDIELTQEEEAETLETAFDIIEEEHLQDEEFENNVTKIKKEVYELDNSEFADYINGFFGVSPDDHPIACTTDKSKFEWERSSSQDN